MKLTDGVDKLSPQQGIEKHNSEGSTESSDVAMTTPEMILT